MSTTITLPPDLPHADYIASRCIEVGDCLEWQCHVADGGGPSFRLPRSQGNKMVLIRRHIAQHLGLLEAARPGARATTSCRNPRCINPAHVVASTPRAIIKAAVQANPGAWRTPARVARLQTAARKQKGILTLDQVREIRQRTDTGLALATAYGVSASTISAIRTHRLWRDVSANPFAGLMRGTA